MSEGSPRNLQVLSKNNRAGSRAVGCFGNGTAMNIFEGRSATAVNFKDPFLERGSGLIKSIDTSVHSSENGSKRCRKPNSLSFNDFIF